MFFDVVKNWFCVKILDFSKIVIKFFWYSFKKSCTFLFLVKILSSFIPKTTLKVNG